MYKISLLQECYNLPASASTLRAVSKGDTLLVIYRLKVSTPKHRYTGTYYIFTVPPVCNGPIHIEKNI